MRFGAKSTPARPDLDPSWDTFFNFLSDEKYRNAEVVEAFVWLRELLGESWIRRQYRDQSWIPEVIAHSQTHSYMGSMLVLLVNDLRLAVDDETFGPVFTKLKRARGIGVSEWRHAGLQAEVARAFRAHGRVTFEPSIEGSDNLADVLVEPPAAEPWLVETKSLLREQADQGWQDYERGLSAALEAIQRRCNVAIKTVLSEHLSACETEQLLSDVEAAAIVVSRSGLAQSLQMTTGEFEIRPSDPPNLFTSFDGAPRFADGSRRLCWALNEKARQSAGPLASIFHMAPGNQPRASAKVPS